MRFAERQALDFAPDVRPLLAPPDGGLLVGAHPSGVAFDQRSSLGIERFREEVEIGDRVVLHPGAVLGADGFGLAFDRAADEPHWIKVPQLGGVRIGDDCLISPNVSIVGSNYRYDRLDVPVSQQGESSKGVAIGNDVWIGVGCAILDGARIGDHAIVAPNAVVSGPVGGLPPTLVVKFASSSGVQVQAVGSPR